MKNRFFVWVIFTLPGFACFSQTFPDSISELKKVVVEGSGRYKVDDPSASLRVSTPLLQLPQNVQVISERTLRDQQIFDMLEGATRNVSGAMRTDSWDNYASILMRGGTVTPFRNGMNVKMPSGPFLEDMSMVERIEFVKGPAGFMLANGEPTGFYNIVTKKPTGVTKGEATLSLGSFDFYRATLDLDGKLSDNGKLLYRFNVMGQMKNSHRDFDFNNRYTIVPVIAYKFNENTSLTAEYTYQYMRMAMLGSAYVFSPNKYGDLPRNLSLLDANLDPTDIREHNIYLTLNHRIDPNWRFTAQLAYFNYQQQGASMWPAYPVGLTSDGVLTRSVANWDAFNESRLGQAYVNGRLTTGAVTHQVLAGLDMGFKSYYADYYQVFTLTGFDIYGNPVPFNVYNAVHGFIPADAQPRFDRSLPLRQRGGGTEGESYNSMHVQDELQLLNNRLRITLAGRYSKLKQHSFGTYSNDHKFTPRAGVSVSLDKSTVVYGLYDQSFLAQQGTDSASKPFVPVTGNSLEAGVKKDWGQGKWTSSVSAYRIIRNNVVSVVPGPQYRAIQTGQTKTVGAELDVRGEVSRGLNLIFNYAYTDAEVTRDEDAAKVGGPVPNVMFADHISNGWLNYRVSSGKIKGLGAGLGYQYQARRKEELPDYFRLDGNLSWQGPQFGVALNVNNILDDYLFMGSLFEHNNDPSSIEYNFQVEAGVNLRATFSYRF